MLCGRPCCLMARASRKPGPLASAARNTRSLAASRIGYPSRYGRLRLPGSHDPQLLAAWPSRDLVVAAHQQLTVDWWQTRRGTFDLYVSELVLQEASLGDPDLAARRLGHLTDIPTLAITPPTQTLPNPWSVRACYPRMRQLTPCTSASPRPMELTIL
jgi:hypothetical protein